MTDDVQRWRRAHEAAVMRGWDFSVLDGRLRADDPPWDFEADCLAALRGAHAAIDLGTGGGERLSRLLDRIPVRDRPRVTATEGWEPNVPVARAALARYGVDVLEHDAERGQVLPVPDASADVVMARHEAYDAADLARVLRPGGVFLAQEVDGRDAEELRAWFGGEQQYPDVRLEPHRRALEGAGLVVRTAEEWAGTMTFSDVGALVCYLGLVPWDVEDFRVDDHVGVLRELDRRGPIVVTQRRFRLTATRP